jgi:hypothetical protein
MLALLSCLQHFAGKKKKKKKRKKIRLKRAITKHKKQASNI